MNAENELPPSHNENRRPRKIRIFLLSGALIALIALLTVFWAGLLVWSILYLIRHFLPARLPAPVCPRFDSLPAREVRLWEDSMGALVFGEI
jgi:hypothetical protein